MLARKAKKQYERPPRIARGVLKQQQAQEAVVAMAEYKKSRQALLERMTELRAARLSQLIAEQK